MAEANGVKPDCDNCGHGREPIYESQLVYNAINLWRRLDLFGREIDTYTGMPRPLRIEAIEIECEKFPDAIGMRWRIMTLEERIFEKRVKKYIAEAQKRKNK